VAKGNFRSGIFHLAITFFVLILLSAQLFRFCCCRYLYTSSCSIITPL